MVSRLAPSEANGHGSRFIRRTVAPADGGMVEVITVSYNENIVTRTPHRHSAIVEGFRMVGAAGLGKLNCLELEE